MTYNPELLVEYARAVRPDACPHLGGFLSCV